MGLDPRASPKCFTDRLEPLRVDIDQEQICAQFVKLAGTCAADPTRCPGDDELTIRDTVH